MPDVPPWDISYKHIIVKNGRWDIYAQYKNSLLRSNNEYQIQLEVAELATDLFSRKIWEENGAEISAIISVRTEPAGSDKISSGKDEVAKKRGRKPKAGTGDGGKAEDKMVH